MLTERHTHTQSETDRQPHTHTQENYITKTKRTTKHTHTHSLTHKDTHTQRNTPIDSHTHTHNIDKVFSYLMGHSLLSKGESVTFKTNLQKNTCMKMADTYCEHYTTSLGWFISNFLKKNTKNTVFQKPG